MSRKPRDNQNSNPQPAAKSYFKEWAVCCLLFLAVLLVFGQTFQHDFILCDDDPYIYGNSHVNEGFYWKNWQDNSFYWSLTTSNAGNWHPLTWLSHILDVQFYGIHYGAPWSGPEAGGHHLTNVLLHAAAAIVLFLALQRMTGAFWCSALVAAMFAIHPLRAESVAWAAERKDVLSGLFWMLTLFVYGGYALRPSVGRYLAVACVFALGLMAKSMLVTLPCVLLLLDFWPMGRWRPKRFSQTPSQQAPSRFAPRSLGWLVVEKLPLLALSAIVSAIVAISQRSEGCMNMVDFMPMDCRIANAAVAGVAYLWKTIWPIHLAIFYPHATTLGTEATARLIWCGIAAGTLLMAITLWVLWNLRRRPYLTVGWFWYLGTLMPVIGLIQVGGQSMADRYTYLPMIGVYIMAVWGGAELAARSPRLQTTMRIAAGGLLAIWMVVAFFQVATWKNSFTVFQHAIQVTDDNYFAHTHLGLSHQFITRNTEAAMLEYVEAVRIAPSYDAANTNLGGYYMRNNQSAKALECFEKAASVNRFSPAHRFNLGNARLAVGKIKEAEADFREAIRLNAEFPHAHSGLADIYIRQGNVPSAIEEFREAIRLNPYDFDAMANLSLCLSTDLEASLRNGKVALEFADRANRLTKGKNPRVLNILAAAYAELGRYEEAVGTAREALKIASQEKNQALINSIQTSIRSYENEIPLRLNRSQPTPEPLPSL